VGKENLSDDTNKETYKQRNQQTDIQTDRQTDTDRQIRKQKIRVDLTTALILLLSLQTVGNDKQKSAETWMDNLIKEGIHQ